jgi:hypothetical protein
MRPNAQGASGFCCPCWLGPARLHYAPAGGWAEVPGPPIQGLLQVTVVCCLDLKWSTWQPACCACHAVPAMLCLGCLAHCYPPCTPGCTCCPPMCLARMQRILLVDYGFPEGQALSEDCKDLISRMLVAGECPAGLTQLVLAVHCSKQLPSAFWQNLCSPAPNRLEHCLFLALALIRQAALGTLENWANNAYAYGAVVHSPCQMACRKPKY